MTNLIGLFQRRVKFYPEFSLEDWAWASFWIYDSFGWYNMNEQRQEIYVECQKTGKRREEL